MTSSPFNFPFDTSSSSQPPMIHKPFYNDQNTNSGDDSMSKKPLIFHQDDKVEEIRQSWLPSCTPIQPPSTFTYQLNPLFDTVSINNSSVQSMRNYPQIKEQLYHFHNQISDSETSYDDDDDDEFESFDTSYSTETSYDQDSFDSSEDCDSSYNEETYNDEDSESSSIIVQQRIYFIIHQFYSCIFLHKKLPELSLLEEIPDDLETRNSSQNPILKFKFNSNIGSINSLRKICLTLSILKTINQLLETNRTMSLREFYYTLAGWVSSQSQTNSAIQVITQILKIPRHHLNIKAASKGLCFGNFGMRIHGSGHDWLNVATHPAGYTEITGDINVINSLELCTLKNKYEERIEYPRYLLIIEKECTFYRLIKEPILRKMGVVMITGKGYPDLATRTFCSKIVDFFNIKQCHCLVDYNPDGFLIYKTYKYGGSKKIITKESGHTQVKDLQWMGIKSIDFTSILSSTRLGVESMQTLTKRDLVLLKNLISSTLVQSNPEYAFELGHMLENNIRVEIQALNTFGTSYLGKTYLPSKLKM